jgi:hypothetical protein
MELYQEILFILTIPLNQLEGGTHADTSAYFNKLVTIGEGPRW